MLGPCLGLFKGKGWGRGTERGLQQGLDCTGGQMGGCGAEGGLWRSWKYGWMAGRVGSPAPARPSCSAARATLSRAPGWRSVNADTGLGGAHTVYVLTDL